MKRFTETTKWGKEWFQNLSPVSKCLWFYLIENCDCAGIWERNWKLASLQVGAELSAADLEPLGERVVTLESGKIWIAGFVAFQHGKLSPDCKPHIPVIRSLEKHNLLQRVSESMETLSKPLPKGIDTLQGKGKDKGIGKDSEGGQGETDAERKSRELKALSVRIGAIMHRKPDTKWSEKEWNALKKLYPVPDGDLEIMERFYAMEIPKADDFRRHDLCTLLNNWSGELDRARKRLGLIEKPSATATPVDADTLAKMRELITPQY